MQLCVVLFFWICVGITGTCIFTTDVLLKLHKIDTKPSLIDAKWGSTTTTKTKRIANIVLKISRLLSA